MEHFLEHHRSDNPPKKQIGRSCDCDHIENIINQWWARASDKLTALSLLLDRKNFIGGTAIR